MPNTYEPGGPAGAPELPPAAPEARPRPGRWIAKTAPWLLFVGVVLAFAAGQFAAFNPVWIENDTAGYMVLAERILDGGPLAVAEDDIFLHQSHVWVENPQGGVSPKYAPGYPLLLALGLKVAGAKGAFAVSPVAGTLALVGAFLLFRMWMSPAAAALAVAALAANAMFFFYMTYPLTHAVNVCAVTWGMLFLWKWYRKPGTGLALAAGLMLGFSVLVRYTGIIFAPVLVVAALVAFLRDAWRRSFRLAPYLILGLSYAIWPVAAMRYNDVVFGSPFTTGYALSGEQDAFALSYLCRYAPGLFRDLETACLYFLFPLGLLGILVPGGWAERGMRLLWVVPMFVVYSSYYWSSPQYGWASQRFLICLFPVLVGCAFALPDRFSVRRSGRVLLMLLMCLLSVAMNAAGLADAHYRTTAGWVVPQQKAVADAAQGHLADGAAVFVAYPAAFYLGGPKRFVLHDLRAFRPHEWTQIVNPGERAPRRQPRRTERLRAFYAVEGGDLNRHLRERVERYLGEGRQVAFIAPRYFLSQQQYALGNALEFETVHEWDVSIAYHRRGRLRSQSWVLASVRQVAPDA